MVTARLLQQRCLFLRLLVQWAAQRHKKAAREGGRPSKGTVRREGRQPPSRRWSRLDGRPRSRRHTPETPAPKSMQETSRIFVEGIAQIGLIRQPPTFGMDRPFRPHGTRLRQQRRGSELTDEAHELVRVVGAYA